MPRFTIPGALASHQNHRHWRAERRYAKQWRNAAWASLYAHRGTLPRMATDEGARVTVKLTRIYEAPQRAFDPEDTLPYSLKPVRDGIADLLFRGCTKHRGLVSCGTRHDGDPRITWTKPTQQKGTPARVEVTVEVEEERA